MKQTKNTAKSQKIESNAIVTALVAAFGIAPFFGASAAQAQDLSGGIQVAGQLTAPMANDIVIGQNKPGPYTLGWNHFLRDFNHPIRVTIDGQIASTDAYTLDSVKGIITFTQPLKTTSLARVDYYYNPVEAKRNADYTQTPVTVPLMNIAGSGFQVTALSGSLSPNGATQLVYGADRQTNLLGGGLASKFMATNGGTAMNFGYKYGGARNGFDATFLRTEKSFATRVGKPLNLQSPLEQLGLGMHMKPMNFLGFTANTSDSHDLAADSNKTSHGLGLNLGGAAPTQPTLNFSQAQDLTETATHDKTDVTTDKVDMAAKLGAVTALTAKGQRVTTDAPGDASDTTAQDAAVALTAVSKDKKQQATLAVTDSTQKTASADNQTQDVQLKVQPIAILTVSAEQKDQKSDSVGTTTTPSTSTTQTSLGAEFVPIKTTKLTGSVATVVTGDTHTSVTDLGAQVGTSKAIELGGGITNRSNSTPGTTSLDTKRANLALRPWKAFTLTGGYTWNPVNNGVVSDATRQDLGLATKLGGLDFGSVYSLTTLNNIAVGDAPDPQFGQVTLTLGLRVDKFTSIKGNYQDSLFYGNAYSEAESVLPHGSRIYGLNVSHSLGSAFNVSLDGAVTRSYVTPTPTPGYKAQATIGAKF